MPRLKYYNNETNQWEYADNVTGNNIDLTNYATKTYVDNSKVAIDTTLQIQGQAADAKAVGEALKNKLASSELSNAINTALTQAKESGEFDGENGVSPTISLERYNNSLGKGLTVTVNNPDGSVESYTIPDGKDGKNGFSAFASVTKSGNVATITTEDNASGTRTVEVYDGKDYVLTEEDKNEIAEIAAGKAQLEFVDTTEECIDTKKRYVLPDGHIYAYMLAPAKYKNWLKYATSENGGTEIFNKDDTPGYEKGLRITSLGTIEKNDNMCITGYIPIKYQDIIRLKNITLNNSSYFSSYIDSGWATVLNITDLTPDEHGIISLTVKGESWNAARLSVAEINDTSIITVNEEIVDEEIYQWADTGYSFVTDAYNTKLTTIEETVQTNSKKIKVIEESISGTGFDNSGVSSAVIESAANVVDTALTREDSRILRFIAIADAHHKNEGDLSTEITASTKELGQAIGEVLRQIGVDFVANLGDTTWGSSASDNATVLVEGKTFNKLVTDNIRGETQLWIEGNHETDMLTDSQIHSLIYSHNKGLIQDTDHWIEGYGYMDFPNQKVRVICLNTNQSTGNDASGVSNTQLKWLAEIALNMEGKSDWGIITMGHHPIGYNNITIFRDCATLIESFSKGTTFSFPVWGSTKQWSIDYSGKNCKYIGHFHGHAHTYTILPINKRLESGGYEELDAYEICIPNACASRTDQYSTKEDTDYIKRYHVGGMDYNRPTTDGKRTAFTIVTVCLDSMVIYADDYGVVPTNYNRYVYYGDEEKVTYSVTNTLTNVTNSNSVTSVLEGDVYTATLTAESGYELSTVMVTMGGTDVTSTRYSDGVVTIPEVDGDIVITATATQSAVKPVYTNLILSSKDTDGVTTYGEDYNNDGKNDGYKTNTYLSSGNANTRSGVETTGFIPFDGSENYVIYLSGITGTQSDSNFLVSLYTSDDKSYVQTFNATQLTSNNYSIPIAVTTGADGNITSMDFTNIIKQQFIGKEGKNVAFFRLCAPNIDGSSVITVNEPIE